MENQTLDQPQTSTENLRYTNFWIRVAAIILDAIVLGVIQTFIAMIVVGDALVRTEDLAEVAGGRLGVFYALNIIIPWLYFAILESSSKQATVGKMAVGVKVIDAKNQKISFGRATGRYFGKYLSTFIIFIGFIMAAFDSKKQALHDKLARTFVVYRRRSLPVT